MGSQCCKRICCKLPGTTPNAITDVYGNAINITEEFQKIDIETSDEEDDSSDGETKKLLKDEGNRSMTYQA
ncbi:myristylated tegument phosphoprotein pp28 [Suid betaherpesvirus 2]|uniref:Cytoplasmic envelopment protein 3 n=1 Tax=Suid betaherpesvirus 2 TaxID=1608255 RepID=U3GVB8_9BETA|nr:myristylated tegument phosphoprotein pp28 [Suid betaherpesvirus 2]AGT99263.1 myristylated tegument phosphoprotein pp28 [Suid betaherpesvirus 2]